MSGDILRWRRHRVEGFEFSPQGSVQRLDIAELLLQPKTESSNRSRGIVGDVERLRIADNAGEIGKELLDLAQNQTDGSYDGTPAKFVEAQGNQLRPRLVGD